MNNIQQEIFITPIGISLAAQSQVMCGPYTPYYEKYSVENIHHPNWN